MQHGSLVRMATITAMGNGERSPEVLLGNATFDEVVRKLISGGRFLNNALTTDGHT